MREPSAAVELAIAQGAVSGRRDNLFADERRALIGRQSQLVKEALRDDDAAALRNRRRHFGWLLLCLAVFGWWRVYLAPTPTPPRAAPAAAAGVPHIAFDEGDDAGFVYGADEAGDAARGRG